MAVISLPRALVASMLVLGGCPPPAADVPPASTEGPPQDSAEPPIPASICDQIGGGEELDDGTTGVGSACPEQTEDAIRIEWVPSLVRRRTAPGVAHFSTKNLLSEQVEVEYEATARVLERDETFAIRFREPQRSYAPLGGGMTGMDLQYGVTLGILDEGEIELEVGARLLRPTRTPMVVMSRVVVEIKLDEDGYIYDIDLVEE